MKKICSYICLALLLPLFINAQNTPPQISEFVAGVIADNTLQLGITVEDAENDVYTFRLYHKNAEGAYEEIDLESVSVDYQTDDPPLTSGSQHIVEITLSPDFELGNELKILVDDGQPFDIQSLVDQVDSNRLRTDLEFVQGVRHRDANPEHLTLVKSWIFNEFENRGLDVSLQPFTFGNNSGENIIGKKVGIEQNDTTYIIDGHFDTVEEAPGADDNGTAVVGFIEALRLLSPYHFTHNIKFIGFDAEEDGLIGSTRYVTEPDGIEEGEHIGGVLNFEMIGYYSEVAYSQSLPFGFGTLFPDQVAWLEENNYKGDFVINVANEASTSLMEKYENAVLTYVPELKILSLAAPGTGAPDLRRSDHAKFWDVGIQALMLTDGANFRNPHYHTPNDVIDHLNFSFMSNIVKGAVATLAELAGIRNASEANTIIDDFTGLVDSKVFPYLFSVRNNPFSQTVQVRFDKQLEENIKVSLLDVNGKEVSNWKIESGSKEITLETNTLEAGMYMLCLNNSKKIVCEKLVIGR